MAWTVGEAAALAKVSVRTLHHYDEIGLLGVSRRSQAGYRLYEAADLERLHQILLFRELGFSLDEIGRIMLAPDFDRTEALRAQRNLLAEKATRTQATVAAIDVLLDADEKGTTMSDSERAEMFGDLFDGFNPDDYEDEVVERWGETDAYEQSAERTKRYTKADCSRSRPRWTRTPRRSWRSWTPAFLPTIPRLCGSPRRSGSTSRSGSTTFRCPSTPRWRRYG